MTGQKDLNLLLASMDPTLVAGEFVFCTEGEGAQADQLHPVLQFREAEGLTFIVPKEEAEARAIPFQYLCRQITLNVHSSLSAVGFLAAITQKLAAQGISVNAVSAYYHDHLFISSERVDEAMKILRGLVQESQIDRNEKVK